MKILVACEESQVITIELRKLGHEAYSCDLIECSGGHPEWHIQKDAIKVAYDTSYGWEMMIAHPPCTYLAVSGCRWLKNKDGSLNIERYIKMGKALQFFETLYNAPIEKIAIENPVGVVSSKLLKPTQYIEPYQFGHPETKKTGLWLKNLPPLKETNNVYDHMMTLDVRQRNRIHWLGSGKSKERSKTYEGIAQAIAEQWCQANMKEVEKSELFKRT